MNDIADAIASMNDACPTIGHFREEELRYRRAFNNEIDRLEKELRPAVNKLRRYVRRKLKLAKSQYITFHDRGWCVVHHEDVDRLACVIRATIYTGVPGVTISLQASADDLPSLDRWLAAVRDALEGIRGPLA